MTVNGIYLPGWEYNRLLSTDPLVPRNSALPGALFWNGAAPLWMFEKVYCTGESLANEQFAAQEIGWATSRIFSELAAGPPGEGPILEAVDWRTLTPAVLSQIRQVHSNFRKDHPGKVSEWIGAANDPALEQAACAVPAPVAAAKNSIIAGSMSGLRHWLAPASATSGPAAGETGSPVSGLLKLLSDPIEDRMVANGLHLLRHPRTWDASACASQDQVRDAAETPFIRELTAGEGSFAGTRGFESYIRNLAQHRAVYKAVDEPLLKDWATGLPSLLRIRETASRHLWPALHGDWLPAILRRDTDAIADFPRYITAALRSRHLARIMNLSTRQVFGVAAAALAVGGAPTTSIGALAAGGVSAAVALFSDRRFFPNVGPLAMFYQEAYVALRNT